MALWTGWLACAAIVLAGAVPTLHRAVTARRAAPLSTTLRGHEALGVLAAILAYVHVGSSLPSLGDPSIVGAGTLAVAPALLAAFLLMAHVGLGLRLSSPRLKERVRFRRMHAVVASLIVVSVLAHVVALRS